eukprot:524184-Hanusia_phi.AAC.3
MTGTVSATREEQKEANARCRPTIPTRAAAAAGNGCCYQKLASVTQGSQQNATAQQIIASTRFARIGENRGARAPGGSLTESRRRPGTHHGTPLAGPSSPAPLIQ